MTDGAAGCRPTRLEADGTRSVQTSTTNIGAYMWSALVARAARDHRARRGWSRRLRDDRRRSSGWSATRRAASSSTGTTTARGEADHLAAHRRAARRRSSPRSTTAGSPTGLRVVQRPVPELSAPRRRALRLHGLRLLLPAGGQPDPLPLRARAPARRPAATTRSSARAGSPVTSASPRARSRSGTTSARWRSFPDSCDWSWSGDTAARRRAAPTSASTCSRAPTPTPARA